jgi:hypothetical protein
MTCEVGPDIATSFWDSLPPTPCRLPRHPSSGGSIGQTDGDDETHRLSRVWLDDCRIVAVRPKEAFAPFFLGAPAQNWPEEQCLKSGSDGTRTRIRHPVEIQ